MRRILDDE
nr:hypothetical protein [Tanacetum cinerariifolium]